MNPITESTRRILIDPLLLLLKSRRVLIALTTLVLSLLLTALPELAPLRTELLTILLTLSLTLIGGLTVEDALRIARQPIPAAPLEDTLKQTLTTLIEELLTRGHSRP